MPQKVLPCLVALTLCLAGWGVIYAEGTFEIYNTIAKDVEVKVHVTGVRSGKSIDSGSMIGFKEKWEVRLQGGQYKLTLIGRNFRKDLGVVDFGDRDFGRVYVGWNTQPWRLAPKRDEQGNTQLVWTLRTTAAPLETFIIARVENGGAGGAGAGGAGGGGGKPRLGITAKKCDKGIHILSVAAGSPATRCRDLKDGQSYTLIPGDHILSVNGTEPATLEEFLSLVAESGAEMTFVVTNEEGTNVQRMKTKLSGE